MQKELRTILRHPFFKTMKFSMPVIDMKILQRVNKICVSVDVSEKGIGILTGYPLAAGHVLTFEDEIQMQNCSAKIAIVRWTRHTENNKYRAGLEFV
jgi:hypothetical protein